MEKAPSHSGVFLNVPLKRWVSRVHDLVGADWQVASQSMIWWAGESACTVFVVHLRHCHQSELLCSNWAQVALHSVSAPLPERAEIRYQQLISINEFWELILKVFYSDVCDWNYAVMLSVLLFCKVSVTRLGGCLPGVSGTSLIHALVLGLSLLPAFSRSFLHPWAGVVLSFKAWYKYIYTAKAHKSSRQESFIAEVLCEKQE